MESSLPQSREEFAAWQFLMEEEAMMEWFAEIVCERISIDGNMAAILHDGVLVCKLMAKLHANGECARILQHKAPSFQKPESLLPSNATNETTSRPRSSSFMIFESRDRANAFLTDCQVLGVDSLDLFSVDDLCMQKNIVHVMDTFFALARVAESMHLTEIPLRLLHLEGSCPPVSRSRIQSAITQLQALTDSEKRIERLFMHAKQAKDAPKIIEHDLVHDRKKFFTKKEEKGEGEDWTRRRNDYYDENVTSNNQVRNEKGGESADELLVQPETRLLMSEGDRDQTPIDKIENIVNKIENLVETPRSLRMRDTKINNTNTQFEPLQFSSIHCIPYGTWSRVCELIDTSKSETYSGRDLARFRQVLFSLKEEEILSRNTKF